MKKFSIIIPTMWKSNKIFNLLEKYNNSNLVGEIIIIDNEPKNKPDLSKFNKIVYITKNKNLFVNPSWNLGQSIAKYEKIFSNDDIVIDELDKILILIGNSDYDIIGLGKEYGGEIKIDKIDNFPRESYGSFFFVKKYYYVPEQIKIWCGDDIQFRFSAKKGIINNSGIHSNSSETVNQFKKIKSNILENDKKEYENLIKSSELNIVIRTSNRPNFFRNCVDSIKNFTPNAKIHVTIDNEQDIKYVKENLIGLNHSIYKLNYESVHNLANMVNIPKNRRRFNYNYYFNVVRPFLNGWVFYLDDDDILVSKLDFDKLDISKIFIVKTKNDNKIYPGEKSFKKLPVLNDINTKCIITHSKNIVDWIPNKGGDFDFINKIYQKNKKNIIWINKIFSKTQLGENLGRRNDRKVFYGNYLNLKSRNDRNEKMIRQIKKTKYTVERFEAIDGKNIKMDNTFQGTINGSEKQQYATYLSHLKMMKLSLSKDFDYFIILEDDVTLCDDFDERLDFFISKIPNDFDIGYIGFNEQTNTSKTKVTDYIYLVKNVMGCFGMVIKKSFIPKIIKIIESKKGPIDNVINTEIQKNGKCYAFIPFLLYVNNDYSDIWKKNRVLGKIQKNFKNLLFNTNKKDVSVIIPTYKNTKYLKECLDSIIRLVPNYNIEILVGIDGCKNTLQYVKNNYFFDSTNFYYFNQNLGPYSIKNTLAKVATSNNLLFFDSDDIMNPNMIDTILNGLNRYICVKPKFEEFGGKSLKGTKFGEGVFGIRKDIFLSMNGFEPWKMAADSDFMGRLYKKRVSILHTPQILFKRRVHPESLTNRKDTGMYSPLRAHYARLSKNKKGHGNPVELHTRDYIEINISNDLEVNSIPQKEKNSVLNLLNRVQQPVIVKEKKEVNYEEVNKVIYNKSNNKKNKKKGTNSLANKNLNVRKRIFNNLNNNRNIGGKI